MKSTVHRESFFKMGRRSGEGLGKDFTLFGESPSVRDLDWSLVARGVLGVQVPGRTIRHDQGRFFTRVKSLSRLIEGSSLCTWITKEEGDESGPTIEERHLC